MILSEYLKEILYCPSCSGSLRFEEKKIKCATCGEAGRVEEGVLLFHAAQDRIESTAFHNFYNDANYQKGIREQRKRQHLHYSEKSLSGKLENYFKNELVKIVSESPRPFFDIGCGTGSGFKHLGYPKDIVGIDLSFDLVKTAKKSYPDADCICCDITNAPIKEGSLKTVFSLETLEHIFHLENFVEAIANLLSDDGTFYVLIPNEGGFAWGILRELAHIKYSREYGVHYKDMLRKVHCNTAYTIDNTLRKFFQVNQIRSIPFIVGGINLNFTTAYALKKRI